jgi:pSer/pThr/pTyr-binding forkhead associated (FHA) protein
MSATGLRLIVDKGPSAGAELALANGSITIGRGPGDDLILTGDEFVSARHARIVSAGGRATLSNQSGNGTLVNGRSVTQITLGPGDVIAVGVMHLIAVRAAARAGASEAPRGGETAASRPQVRQKLPVWLMAYLALMAVIFVFFAVSKATSGAQPGLTDIRVQEQQYAAGRRYPPADTNHVLMLLDTAVVHERRGDRRSAYEAYREVMSVRRPIDPRSPAYRFAAARTAAIGPK